MQAPTFVVIGAQRCGTTSLFEHLRQHPDVFIPPVKELSFFVDGPRWRLGPSWYEAQFAGAGAATHLGDVSPGYSMFPVGTGAVERLASHVPRARLIYSVRHPVDRMISAYWFLRSQGLEQRDIDTALRSDLRYLATSMYGLQVGRYLDRFPRDQVLVVVFEDLRADPAAVLDAVLDHLGLEPGWRPAGLRSEHNAGDRWAREPTPAALLALRALRRRGVHRWRERDLARWRLTSRALRRDAQPSPETLAALEELLVPDLRLLCSHLGWDTDPWGLLDR
jgi:hypothetical protein